MVTKSVVFTLQGIMRCCCWISCCHEVSNRFICIHVNYIRQPSDEKVTKEREMREDFDIIKKSNLKGFRLNNFYL